MANPVGFTAFISKYLCSYLDNVDDPDFASYILDKQGVDSIRYNTLYDVPFQFKGDAADTYEVVLPGLLLTDWVVILANVTNENPDVIGVGKITVDGLYTDGVTEISCDFGGSGNTTYPGKIYYNGYNVETVTLTTSVDNTIIEGHLIVICADTDPRYPTT